MGSRQKCLYLGKETYIEITPRREICNDCDNNPTTTEQSDWYEVNSKMTKPYGQHLLFELVNSTVADVSRKEAIEVLSQLIQWTSKNSRRVSPGRDYPASA